MTQTLEPDTIAPVNRTDANAPASLDIQVDLIGGAMKSPVESNPVRKKPLGMLAVAAWLVPATLVGTGVTFIGFQGGGKSAEAVQAREERDAARDAEAHAKRKLENMMAEQRTMEKERDQALAAEKAARRAEQNAKAVLTFLESKLLLATGNPESWAADGLGKEITLLAAVKAAEAKAAGTFADRPLVEAAIREILGAAYLGLDEAEPAIEQYERALALRKAELGPDDPATGDCRNQLAVAYRRAGRADDASGLFDVKPESRGAID